MAMDEEDQTRGLDDRKYERALLMGSSVLSSLILLAVSAHGHLAINKLVCLVVIALLGTLLFFLVLIEVGRDRNEYYYGLLLRCSFLLSIIAVTFVIVSNAINKINHPSPYYLFLAQLFVTFLIHSLVALALFLMAGEDQSDFDRPRGRKDLESYWDMIDSAFIGYCGLCFMITFCIITGFSLLLDIGWLAAFFVLLAVGAHSWNVPSIGIDILRETKKKEKRGMRQYFYVLFLPHISNTLLLTARIRSTDLFGWVICVGLMGFITLHVIFVARNGGRASKTIDM